MIRAKFLDHRLTIKEPHHVSLPAKEVNRQTQEFKAHCPDSWMHFQHVLDGGGEGRNIILHHKIDTVVNAINTISSIPIIEGLDVAEVNLINFRILVLKRGNYIRLWGGALDFSGGDLSLFDVRLRGNTGFNIAQHSSNTSKTVVH